MGAVSLSCTRWRENGPWTRTQRAGAWVVRQWVGVLWLGFVACGLGWLLQVAP